MSSFRSRKDGSHYPVQGGGLWSHPSRSRVYSKNIHYGNANEARESVAFANEKWKSYTKREERVHLVQAMNEASNRAKAMSENRRLSGSEQRKAAEAHTILRGWVESHKGKE